MAAGKRSAGIYNDDTLCWMPVDVTLDVWRYKILTFTTWLLFTKDLLRKKKVNCWGFHDLRSRKGLISEQEGDTRGKETVSATESFIGKGTHASSLTDIDFALAVTSESSVICHLVCSCQRCAVSERGQRTLVWLYTKPSHTWRLVQFDSHGLISLVSRACIMLCRKHSDPALLVQDPWNFIVCFKCSGREQLVLSIDCDTVLSLGCPTSAQRWRPRPMHWCQNLPTARGNVDLAMPHPHHLRRRQVLFGFDEQKIVSFSIHGEIARALDAADKGRTSSRLHNDSEDQAKPTTYCKNAPFGPV